MCSSTAFRAGTHHALRTTGGCCTGHYLLHLLHDSLVDLWIGMAEDGRAEGLQIVYVLVAIGIVQVRPCSVCHSERAASN